MERITTATQVAYTISADDLRSLMSSVIEETIEKTITAQRKAMEPDVVWLSIEQVSQRLNVTPATLWRWNKEGYLTNYKFGARVRYKLSDVERIEETEKKGGKGSSSRKNALTFDDTLKDIISNR